MGQMFDFKGYLLKSDMKACDLSVSELSRELNYARGYINTACYQGRIDYDALLSIAKRCGTTPKRYMFTTDFGQVKIAFSQMSYSDKIKAMPTETLLKLLRDISLELYDRKENE